MPKNEAVRVAINGYGVIGKRVVDAVALQDDMVVAGVCDVATDWRSRVITQRGFRLHGAAPENVTAMKDAGLEVHGTLSDDIVVDFTPSLPERSDGIRRQSRRLRPVIIDRVRFSWWTKLARTTPMMWMMTRASVRFASTS
jgi:glyceraldehyde-3-phosphate dehydrogenase/erythrose-4-phosphate dehydrogenase